MIFPQDSEIREFASYYIRAIKIFKEEFRDSVGREPSEFELTDFSKMGIIPYGILKQQNGFQKQSQDHASTSQNSGVNKEYANPPAQTKDQPVKQNAGPVESVMDIVNAHKGKMTVDGERVILKGKIDDYWDVIEQFESRGWRHVKPVQLANGWKDGYFEFKGVKA